MPHFKNTNNELFWLDDGDDAATWLPQCTQITDEEAEAIREKSVKEAGENSRAKDANERALESARITAAASIKGHQIAADASLRAAGMKAGREKIDERAYNAIIQTVAQELKLPPNDPKVLEEAFLRFSGAKGLAGPKLSDTTSTQINAEITRATDKDPVLEDLKLDDCLVCGISVRGCPEVEVKQPGWNCCDVRVKNVSNKVDY